MWGSRLPWCFIRETSGSCRFSRSIANKRTIGRCGRWASEEKLCTVYLNARSSQPNQAEAHPTMFARFTMFVLAHPTYQPPVATPFLSTEPLLLFIRVTCCCVQWTHSDRTVNCNTDTSCEQRQIPWIHKDLN